VPSPLEEAFASGRLLRPDPAVPNALHLVQTLAAWAGADPAPYKPSPLFAELAATLRERPRLVFVLIDGLGLSLLEQHAAPDGFLRQALARGGELRSVFPSATASAITTLSTATWPSEHSVTGWWIHEPSRSLDFVSLPYVHRASGEPLPEERRSELFPIPSWLPRAKRPRRVIQPARISDSAYSRYARGEEADFRGYQDLEEAIGLVLEHTAEPTPGYTYLYLPEVDGTSHRFGPTSSETGAAVGEVEAALTRLAAELPPSARLVASADHGQIEVPREARHALAPEDPLRALLAAPPSGEPRAPLFHVLEGRCDEFRAAFGERFGERFHLLEVDEIDRLRLLGPTPLHPRTRARLGDFMALAEGPDVIFATSKGDDGLLEVKGQHGGLHPDEVRIPLLVGA
jgi:type I phosphodiesterase/nucleotide pyrophosphatase